MHAHDMGTEAILRMGILEIPLVYTHPSSVYHPRMRTILYVSISTPGRHSRVVAVVRGVHTKTTGGERPPECAEVCAGEPIGVSLDPGVTGSED